MDLHRRDTDGTRTVKKTSDLREGPSERALTFKKNRVYSCLFVVKNWVVGVSPRQVILRR